MITQCGWLAFFESEHCSVCSGIEFGLEFDLKGGFNLVRMILLKNWDGWQDFSIFFWFKRQSVQNRLCNLYSLLEEENLKAITRLKGFRSSQEAR